MINLILCGGSGTRLWPVSRTLMPKQFVKFFNNKSLFQLTVERNSEVCDNQLIVSNIEQYFLVLDQLEEIQNNVHYPLSTNKYILEPAGKNTAPAIALACMFLDKEEMVLVTPSDHLIKDNLAYRKVLEQAKELAEKNSLVTFGIKPTFAETGFGKKVVCVDPKYFRATEVESLLGDPAKAETKLGWKREYKLEELVSDMMKSDLKLMAKDVHFQDDNLTL